MKSVFLVILLIAATALSAGCSDRVETRQAAAPQAQTAQAAPAAAAPASATAAGWTGKILETMDSGGYTYVHLDTGSEQLWAAAPQTAGLAAGDEIFVPRGMMMPDFHSNTLERDFPEIYFVSGFEKNDGHSHDAAATMPKTMPPAGSDVSPNTVVQAAGVSGVEKLAGGFTVVDIYNNSAALAGQTVKVRARVVKFTPNIMGTNWIHIQDGTGEGPTADLTITTGATAQVGDLVVVEGPLSVNKDFGAGYKYAAIIEKAAVTVE